MVFLTGVKKELREESIKMKEEKRQKQQEQLAQAKLQMEHRAEIFAEYPELKKFVQRKEFCLKFLILFGAVLYGIRAILVRGITGGAVGAMIFGFFMGYGLYFIFLSACMSYQFKVSAYSGVFCICNFILNYIRSLQKISAYGNPIEILREALRINPAVAVLDLIPLVFFVFVCITVLWLLAVPKNRRFAMQYEELLKTWNL